MSNMSIAIDGPAGAGKSTVAKQVARKLDFLYVDTGAMYRAVAWLALQHSINPNCELELMECVEEHKIHFEKNQVGLLDVFVDGSHVTDQLRTPQITEVVSQISIHPLIRSKLTQWQRDFALRYSVVMDGRDIGTVVLPQADIKVYLTADLMERARRRSEEFAAKGHFVSIDEIILSMGERDQRDASRDHAPLKQAADAIKIDSTGKNINQVVSEILCLVNRVKHG